MTIITDDNENQLLNIQEGRIQICDITQERTWVPYFDEKALDLSELSTSGEYYVILAIQFDPTGTGDDNDNFYFPCSVYFASGDSTTNLIPRNKRFSKYPYW